MSINFRDLKPREFVNLEVPIFKTQGFGESKKLVKTSKTEKVSAMVLAQLPHGTKIVYFNTRGGITTSVIPLQKESLI